MKLARKVVFGLLIGVILVLSLGAWLRVQREVDQFVIDMERDHLMVGRAIATGVTRTWNVEGESAGFDFIRSFSSATHHVQVRWVWLEGPLSPETTPRLEQSRMGQVLAGQELAERSDKLGYHLTYVPLTPPSKRKGALEISESMEGDRAYVRRSVGDAVLTTAVLLGVAAVMAPILGTYFVGRPIHHLVGKVRRIATGDLGGPLILRRTDELAELATAINQ